VISYGIYINTSFIRQATVVKQEIKGKRKRNSKNLEFLFL